MMKLLLIFLLLTLAIGCGDKNALPDGILKKEKMQHVMWDMMQADAYTEFFIKKDTTKKPALENLKMQQSIFKLHHVTKDEFYKSYAYYTARPDLMKPLLDSITSKSEKDRSKVMAKRYGAPK